MSIILKSIIDTYKYIDHDLTDPRSADVPLLVNPFFIILLVSCYVKFVINWGPTYMQYREPYKLEKIIKVYNLSQILFCSYVTYRSFILLWWSGRYNIWCQPINFDDTPEEREILLVGYQYYLLKIYDLLDTVFFILKKNQKQVSFLHVYHHTGMVVGMYVVMKYVPVGHGGFIITLNSAMHVLVYFYYLLSSTNPKYKQSSWKKYITQLQILQFVVLGIQHAIALFNPNCTYPKFVGSMFIPQVIFVIVMFSNFYLKAYREKRKQYNKK